MTTETRVPELLGVQIGLTSLALVVVSARLFTRAKIVRGLGSDDLAISFAMVMAIVESTLGCLASKWGTGHHLWDIPTDISLASSLKVSFVVQILYMPILLTTKISILLFYFRLSPNKTYHRNVWILMGISVAFGIAVTFGDIFQCTPVESFYNYNVAGKCIDQMAFFKSTAIINIVNDFAVFVLPLPTLWGLKLPVGQKAALGFILSLGVFVFGWTTTKNSSGLSGLRSRSRGASGNNAGNMYALGSMSDRADNYRGVELGTAEYNAVVVGRGSRDGKENESEEHIISVAYNQQTGITKTMDVTVDVSERVESGR
ncbi:hypothetical protein RUND412_002912 [Rhizina undulata]